MIIGIEGVVESKEPTCVHINVGGLIYELHVSINSSNGIQKGEKTKLSTTQIIREDSQTLFGFVAYDEKRMFDTLIKINGVGPKVALAICSTFIPSTFARIVHDKDVSMLKKVPGIGPKSASRILVELADFIVSNPDEIDDLSHHLLEASMALESLGFKKEQVKKALAGAKGDTSTLVREGLKNLQRL